MRPHWLGFRQPSPASSKELGFFVASRSSALWLGKKEEGAWLPELWGLWGWLAYSIVNSSLLHANRLAGGLSIQKSGRKSKSFYGLENTGLMIGLFFWLEGAFLVWGWLWGLAVGAFWGLLGAGRKACG